MLHGRLVVCFALVAMVRHMTMTSAVSAQSPVPLELRALTPLDEAKTFTPVELELRGLKKYENPFDPGEVRADVEFSGPGGTSLIVPAFWHVPADRADGSRGDGAFRVRFAAPSAGDWRARAIVIDAAGRAASEPIRFTVSKGDADGFPRRAANGRYFQLDSGKPFFLVGPNLAWTNKQTIEEYDRWLKTLAQNGANFARIWMSHPSQMTETKAAGLGRYDQKACAYYDAIFASADRHGIRLMVCFNNHRDLLERDMWGDALWPQLPYNAVNGGPCKTPQDFISLGESRELYKRRLRYIVARYGAYPSAAFWEFWNEQSFAKVEIPPAWTIEMADFLRALDPHDRLITTSFGAGDQEEVWRHASIDLTQHHAYPGEQTPDGSGAVASFHREYARFGKPSLMGEIGIDHRFSDAKVDEKGVGTNMHNTAWAALASGGAGTAAMWWWDNYIDVHNLWHDYRGISAFAAGVDWSKRKFEPIDLPAPRIDGAALSGDTDARDVIVPAFGGWGRSHGKTIVVNEGGQSSRALPGFLLGPQHDKLRTPTKIALTLASPTRASLRVREVSNYAVLRVLIDGKPERDFFFSAPPGTPGVKSSRPNGEVVQSTLDADCELELPAGQHELELEIIAGDWLSIASLTLPRAAPAAFPAVDVYALQCAETGETIAWLRDRDSNWKNDRDGLAAVPIERLTVRIPMKSGGPFEVQWWDTRSGKVIHREPANVGEGTITAQAPTFARDIALRVVPR